jgi:hypothetical protein
MQNSQQFWDSTIPIPECGCLIWEKGQDDGYGKVNFKGRIDRAHRIAWEITYGAIPQGLFICHHCDVRLCVNPKHLFMGTIADNNLDKKLKGRAKGINLGKLNGRWKHGHRIKGGKQIADK